MVCVFDAVDGEALHPQHAMLLKPSGLKSGAGGREPANTRLPLQASLSPTFASQGNLEKVHKLLKVKGLDVNEADRSTGNVALHYAAAKGHLDVVRSGSVELVTREVERPLACEPPPMRAGGVHSSQ
jgi:hypothetical protein